MNKEGLLARAEAMLVPVTPFAGTFESRTEALEDLPEATTKLDTFRSLLKRPNKSRIVLPEGAVIVGKAVDAEQKRTILPNIAVPEQSIVLVTGSPASGKSILGMQFLMEGIKQNESVVYITFEERKENFFKYMSKFGWNLEQAEQAGTFTFVRYAPETIHRFLEDAPALGKHFSRVCIDSLTALAVLCKDELGAREAIGSLNEAMKSWHATTMVLAEETRTPSKSMIALETDASIALYSTRTGLVRQRVSHIATGRTNSIVPFSIGEDGIVFNFDEAIRS